MWIKAQNGESLVNLNDVSMVNLNAPYVDAEFRTGVTGKQKKVVLFLGETEEAAVREYARIIDLLGDKVDPKTVEHAKALIARFEASPEETNVQPGANPDPDVEIDPQKMQAYTLRVLDGRQWKEIAEALESSVATVRRWVDDVRVILGETPEPEEAPEEAPEEVAEEAEVSEETQDGEPE